ncbi:hypothetical protein ARALYDRAFT_902891 [Arabidopsis lyrata subsp. lyrata]|uniref:NYN domain-containing protein n=1 Tax=Arabidopsis lyrata subsp. lyrata TaxID=81972 RepID=D7LJU1_ARALL|nr:hypothetical protein ARALYDRAFT_902891 [Arabidopsis lyrata subsp. lyrata]
MNSRGDKDKRVRRMLFDMITFASSCDDGKQNNVMVISKTPLTDECFRVLGSLEARGFNVLLVQYDDEAELFRSADAIFDSTTLLDGSRPMDFDSVSYSSLGSWETDYDPGNCTDTGFEEHKIRMPSVPSKLLLLSLIPSLTPYHSGLSSNRLKPLEKCDWRGNLS